MNKIVVVTIIHSEYKEFLLNNKCLRRSMNRIQRKNQKIRTSEIINISLLYCDDKEHILNNGYDKAVILMTIQNSFFVKL